MPKGLRKLAEQRKKQKNTVAAFIIVVVIIAAVTILAVVKKFSRTAEQPGPQSFHTHEHEHESAAADSPAEADEETATLKDIVRARSSWDPVFTSWYGKLAPDFAVRDLAGKERKLSDYRGKNVMVVFWATWCPPCKMEIPHLIELRNTLSENELAILAISNESPGTLKRFAAVEKINYTVALLDGSGMPAPFGHVRGIPASFFVDAKGNIKFALEGLATLAEVKAILQAPPLEASRP